MHITYDPPKRLANLVKHGMDFDSLDLGFFAIALVVQANGNRFKAIGRRDDGTIAVIFAMLGAEAISVISMRPANKKERNLLP